MLQINRTRGLCLSVSGLALAAALVVAMPAAAAESDATLQGRVSAAPAGTVVTATDANTGAKASATVSADGRYVIVGLRPGTYNITFRSPDGKSRTESAVLPVGQTIEVNADLAASDAPQEVTVVARRNNPRQSEVSTSISRAQMENLPQNGRNFLNFAALAPGVSVSTDPERKTFQAGAVNANQVNVFIDGVSQKNQILQGGVTGQDASRGNPFPQLAVQEFKVSTQNFKAEYEQAGSAIITAVTKTGGTEFHGTVFGTLQTKSMIGQPFYETGPKQDYENKEYGFDVGGPIIKNKLHFYMSYEGRKDARPSDSVLMPSAATLGGNTALANALASAYNGGYAKDFKQDMVFGKLTWFADDNNTVDVTVMNRKEDDLRGFSGTTAYERGSTLNQEVKAVGVKWRLRAGNLLNDMQLNYQDSQWRQAPLSTSPAITLVGRDAVPAGSPAGTVGTPNINTQLAFFGGLPYSQVKGQESVTLRNDITLAGLEWNGTHVIKGGFKLANYKYTAEENDRSLNPEYFYTADNYVYGGTNTPVAVKIADGDPRITSNNMQFGAYIQDDWTFNEHWTFNLGLRWDYESNMLNNEYTTPADIATVMRSTAGFNVAFNPDDYISNGSNREGFKGALQPRLGFAYDVNADRDLIIFGGYGRYYDRNIYDLAQLETRRAQIHVAQINFTPNGDTDNVQNTATWNASYFGNPTALVALAKSLGLKGEVFALENDAKVPYSDQFNLGVRKRFGAISTSATLSYIKYQDLFNWVLGNRLPNGTWCANGPQYACQPWGNSLPNYGNLIISTNDRQARYKALYLTAEKPWTPASKYGFSTTLTLTDAEMTGHNDSFIFDYANPRDTGWHHAEGVDKWRFVGSGIVSGPWDTRVSAIVTLASGTPFTSIDNTGPALRIIDGYYWPKKSFKQVDLRVSKDFRLPNGQMITVDGQVYNLFDSVNRVYSGWTGGYNGGTGASLAPDATGQIGPSRSFQVGLTYKW
ncbi:MAG: TonB-dependent receptor [Asticcacaulis sp.]